MAIVIALLGVVNSLAASVLDRVREIGVMRAVGATRSQVARSLVIESALVGLAGGAMAVAVGSAFGAIQLEVVIREIFAMTVFYVYPAAATVFAFAAAVALAAAAGWLPGRSAARVRIAEALGYE
jgi:putative ABC transport system permease protein